MRAVAVLLALLALVGWTCQAPPGTSPGSPGAPVTTVASGPTTPGLTALLTGEDWHYVGEAGEPAFEAPWGNAAGNPKLAFRIREAGVVDLHGVVTGGSSGDPIFTLPVGYRPSNRTFILGYDPVNDTAEGVVIETDGTVSTPSSVDLGFTGQFFLVPPDNA